MLNAVGQAQNILLLGGSSEIGLGIVEEFLSRGPARVTLAGRVEEDGLEAAAEQVINAGASDVELLDFDALDTASHPEIVEQAFAHGDVDVAIVAFGVMGDQEEIWQDQAKAVASSAINYTAYVSFGVLLGQYFKRQGHGTIVAMSSVAGMKVRRSNFTYGSAKAGVDGFFTQLGVALEGDGVNVLVVRPGQVRTKLSAHVEEAPFTVDVPVVGKAVVDAILHRKKTLYVHPIFELVTLVLQHIPAPIMKRLPI
ncbi:decaprenylphospho-beta-D-erythro-pentofuranosid-2-ulose 2-reductase [Corynebacterium uterequi]|uniref:Decaprenylphospho-beta-D-erythro-pentofuranosid-2-ulose 2-reductase n=1 Tax=Corynebacterium uterequi TaxID=1072256 RepID=A0A0G3H9V3_9CORY|nr:decaprenylphospho-beta-D-erythro-pentofuranosid-2-ulose 2-reductase [Corynebacterium uterequi]AKK10116.1 short-chain dehydrogenase of unknown substrate specificity [Corynebacterium uterequi]